MLRVHKQEQQHLRRGFTWLVDVPIIQQSTGCRVQHVDLDSLPLSYCVCCFFCTGEWTAALTVQQQQQQHKDGPDTLVVHGESGKTWTAVHNKLGRDADMLLEYGDRQVIGLWMCMYLEDFEAQEQLHPGTALQWISP